MRIEKRKLNELNFYPGNPRRMSDEVFKKLKKSISEFGYVEPLVINFKNQVIGGNQRLKALKELLPEDSEVEVIVVDLPLNREKALNIALNKIQGEFDMNLLKDFIADLEPLDVELTGLDVELEELETDKEIEEDNYEEPEFLAPKSQRGEIYQLGNHRLMCGDATSKEDVEKLMNGEKVDMVFTDPPYGMYLDTDFSKMGGIWRNGDKYEKRNGNLYNKMIGDNEDFNPDFINIIFSIFDYCDEIFLWGANYYSELLHNRNDGSWFVWDKRVDDTFDKMFGSCFELLWSKKKHKQEIVRIRWVGFFGVEQEFDRRRINPAHKSIRLSAWFIERFSNKGDKIVDLFGGSGSTLLACEQLNRRCFMMEIEPHYVDVIIDRWEKFTGKQAIKL